MEANKKKTVKRVIFALAVLIVAAGLVALPFFMEAQQQESSKASVLSAKAETGDIQKTLSGTGTITDSDSQEVSVPEGVLVTEYLVENGDFVNEGDPVARVDKVSVMEAISALRESMNEKAEDIESIRSKGGTSTITAPASAKVKAVYARAGDSVQDVMLENGALAVLSLDGLMSVSFSTNQALSIGDSVSVVLSNEKKVSGRVESVYDGTATVTISDANGSIGEMVVVLSKDGHLIGTGGLNVHSAWKVMATAGTVSKVSVKEGGTVYSGTTLLSISSSGGEEYASLLEEYQKSEDTLAELFKLYTDGVVTAPCDGCVTGADDSILTELAATRNGTKLTLLVNVSDSALLQLLDDVTPMTPVSGDNGGGGDTSNPGMNTQPNPQTSPEPSTDPNAYNCYLGMITSVKDNGDGTVTVNAKLQTTSYQIGDISELSNYNYSAMDISPASMVNEQSFTLQAPVGVEAGDVYVFLESNGGLYMMNFMVAHYDVPSGDIPGGNTPGGGGMPSGGGGFSGGSFGGGGGGGGGFSGSMPDAEEETVSSGRTTILSVTPQDKVTVTITVDELDILAVRLGQEVEVTLDALPGQAFTGVITEVNTAASNDGGNSKYTATVELDRSAFMLGGMNASARITIEERSSVLLIPSAALSDKNGQTVVYTELDSNTQKPASPVAVEIGLSDETNVEIKSGLSVGDTVWYEYYDKLEVEGLNK